MRTLVGTLPGRVREAVRSRNSRLWVTTIAILLFAAAVYVVGSRTRQRFVIPGEPEAAAWGMLDFRDAIYYPVRALLEGNNPYDSSAYFSTYPVGNPFVLYTPMTLVVHLPFGLLPFVPSAVVYFFMTIALMLVLAHVTLRMCSIESSTAAIFALAFAIVISQPGQWNLFLGQCGALVAVAALGAMHLARSQPWLAGLCLSVAAIKPATGLPLALLMLVRGEHLAVLAGVAAAVLIGGIPLLFIVPGAGGIGAFLASMSGNYASFTANPASAAATSPYRVDVAALVSRVLGWSVSLPAELLIMLAILGISAVALRRLAKRDDDDARFLSSALLCVAVLICVYHPSNEALFLSFPIVMMGRRCLAQGVRTSPVEWLLFAAAATPAVNYLTMGGVVGRMRPGGAMWLAVTSLSGGALLVAFCALCGLALKGIEPYGARGSVSSPMRSGSIR